MIAKCCQERESAEPVVVRPVLEWSDELERLVRRFAKSWARNFRFGREDSEDLEQDAVLLAFAKVRSGRITSREGLWILVRNSCFDAWGKGVVDSVEYEEGVVSTVFSGVGRSIVAQVEAELPELVMMAEARAAGYSWDEVAEALGVPCGTLRVQWSRLTARARQMFGEELVDVLRV